MTDQQLSAVLDLTDGHVLPPDAAVRALAGARRRRRRTVAGGTAGVAVLTAGGVGLALVAPGGTAHPTAALRQSPAAAGPTSPAAPSTSSTVTDAELAAAQWFSVSSTTGADKRTIWFRHSDGDVVLQDTHLGPAFDVGTETFAVANSDELTWDQLTTVPTDVTSLRARLGAGGRPDLVDKLAMEVLMEMPAPSGLREGATKVLEQDSTVTTGVTDSTGRPATRLAVHGHETLFIDPATWRLLEVTGGGWATTYTAWGIDAPVGPVQPQPTTPQAEPLTPAEQSAALAKEQAVTQP